MELDEAIKHCEDKAKELRKEKYIMARIGREREWADCLQCAEEHEQLAEWLKDYKRLLAERGAGEARPTGEWVHDYDDFYHCSICKRGICTEWQSNPSKYYPYCHCGAKMKEAEDEQV